MDGLEDFRDLQGNNANDFIKAYRDSLKGTYDSELQRLQQQRRNDYASIMSQANRRGMMYSNFPERAKMQYEANTYLPNVENAFKTYQTGLDKLRSDALGSYNAIKTLQDQIAHYNSLNNDDDGVNGEYGEDGSGGVWFKNANGKAVRFSTFARDNGYDATTESYLKAAKKYMSEENFNRLLNIVKLQQNTSHPNLLHNANSYGGTYQDYDYMKADGKPYLNASDRSFINNLGLTFGK